MRSAPDCFQCSVSQAVRTIKLARLDRRAQDRAAREAARAIEMFDHRATPAVVATAAIRAAERVYGEVIKKAGAGREGGRTPGLLDAFRTIKQETTREALALYSRIGPEAQTAMRSMNQVERIRYCAKLGAAGNIIDFGVGLAFDLEQTLDETLAADLAIDQSLDLCRAVDGGEDLLLISDNAGEIVFDRFLLDEVMRLGKRVYVSVKSGPILNDATREDALTAGLPAGSIIETGSSSLGIILEECSQEFRDLFRNASVVLAKGQANYETLDTVGREMFFILRAKCPIVAKAMRVQIGSSVLAYHSAHS